MPSSNNNKLTKTIAKHGIPAPPQQPKNKKKALPQRRKAAKPKRRACPKCPLYKLPMGDAPTRVDKLETRVDFIFNEGGTYSSDSPYGQLNIPVSPVNISQGHFNSNTLFIWFPRVAKAQLLVIDTSTIGNAYIGSFSTRLDITSDSNRYHRWGTVPSMESLMDMKDHVRVMPINAAGSITTNFGHSGGKLRFKRLSEQDTSLTAVQLLNRLQEGTHGVGTKELTGKQTTTLKPHIHNKEEFGTYSDVMSRHFTYAKTLVIPSQADDDNTAIGLGEDTTDGDNQPGFGAPVWNSQGKHPFCGWAFTFPIINTAPMMPRPRVYFCAELRLQRELILDEAYLEDNLRKVDIEVLQKNHQHGPGVVHAKDKGDARSWTSSLNSIVIPAAHAVASAYVNHYARPGLNMEL